MLRRLRLRTIRNSQIATLQAYIDGVYESELSKVETPEERNEAVLRAQSICKFESNELALLQKDEIREKGNSGSPCPLLSLLPIISNLAFKHRIEHK